MTELLIALIITVVILIWCIIGLSIKKKQFEQELENEKDALYRANIEIARQQDVVRCRLGEINKKDDQIEYLRNKLEVYKYLYSNVKDESIRNKSTLKEIEAIIGTDDDNLLIGLIVDQRRKAELYDGIGSKAKLLDKVCEILHTTPSYVLRDIEALVKLKRNATSDNEKLVIAARKAINSLKELIDNE